jgi:DNA-directed RNA polymerase specialized sigma24 family protein
MTHDPRAAERQRYREALATLPTIPRIVFLLHSLDTLSYEEIAFRIGEDIGAVERHFATALKHLVREIDGPRLQ